VLPGTVTAKEGQLLAWIGNLEDIEGKQFLDAIVDIVKQLSQRGGCLKSTENTNV
jgi:hypothetical protein